MFKKLLSHNLSFPILLIITLLVIIIAVKKNKDSNRVLSSQIMVIEDWEAILVEKPEYEVANSEDHILVFHNCQCPYCKSLNDEIGKLKESHDFNISYYNRVFAYDVNIINASLASECAKDQNIFQDYHNLLYENFANLGNLDFTKVAYELGVQDTTQFRSCFETQEKLPILYRDVRIADSLGIDQVPTIIINGNMATGVANSELIKYMLNKD